MKKPEKKVRVSAPRTRKTAVAKKRPQPAVNVGSSRVAAVPPPSAQAFIDRGAPVPTRYGHDRIVAEVRDPNGIFVYWALEGSACEDLKSRMGRDVFDGASWVLRFHSDSFDAARDVPISPEARNWYVQVPENRRYVIDIGVVLRDGRFIPLAQADPVHTPRSTPSDDLSCEWMLVDGDFRVTRLGATGRPGNGHFADDMLLQFQRPTGSSQLSSRVSGSHNMGSLAIARPRTGTIIR